MADADLDKQLEELRKSSGVYAHIIDELIKKAQDERTDMVEAKKAIRNQIIALDNATKTYKKSSAEISDSIKKIKENFEKGALTAQDLEDKLATLRNEVNKTTDKEKKAALIAEKAALEEANVRNKTSEIFKDSMGDLGGAVLKGFANSVTKTASAALRGGDALSVATEFMSSNIDTANAASQAGSKALSTFGAATAGAGGKIGTLGVTASIAGAAIGFLSNSVSELAKAGIGFMLTQTQKLMGGFGEMSASGAVFAGGMIKMVETANSAGMTLEQFSKTVTANKDLLAKMGIGVSEGAKKLASAMNYGGDPVRKGMFALGMSMEQQADAYAQTMAAMAGPRGKLAASDAEISAQTEEYAKNLKTLSALTGEDTKAKQNKLRQDNDTLAFNQQLDAMGATERAKINDAMLSMSEDQQRAFRERMIYGSLISKDLAITEATNSGIAKANEQSYKAALDGSLSSQRQQEIQKANAKEAHDQAIENKALAMAGSEDAKAAAASQNKSFQYMQQFAKTDEERAKIAEEQSKGKTSKPGEKGTEAVDLMQVQQDFAVKMEKIAAKNLPEFSKAINTTIKDIESSVISLVNMSASAGTTPSWVTGLIGVGSALTQIIPLMMGLSAAGGGGVAGAAAGGATMLGKAGKFLKGKGGAVGSVLTAGMAVSDYNDISDREKAGFMTPEEAKKAKSGVAGEAGGGIAGSLAGAAAGAALGSVVPVIGTAIGGIIGGILGGMGGGALGKAGGEAVSGHFANGGIASGPATGYASMLHGTELVLPMKEGGGFKEGTAGMGELMKMIGMGSNSSSSGSDEMAQLVKEQNAKLDDLIRIMGDNRDYTERLMHNMS